MKERLKQLRKTLDLTQQEFAEKLGIKRSTMATYESGRNEPIDAVISLICREFDVNEHWLRTGTGEMFTHQTDDEQLTSFIVKILANKSTSFKRKFISMLSALDESDWDVLEKMVTLLKKRTDSISPPLWNFFDITDVTTLLHKSKLSAVFAHLPYPTVP